MARRDEETVASGYGDEEQRSQQAKLPKPEGIWPISLIALSLLLGVVKDYTFVVASRA